MPLTEKERQIILTVVSRFLNLKEPSPHKLLIRQCKDPKAIERLVSGGVLNSLGTPAAYLPRVLAFEHCGDLEALRRAKSAATVVVKVLQNLFEVELDKENFTADDVYEHARKMYDSPPSRDDIDLGLFVAAEFANVLKSFGSDSTHTKMTTLQMSDNILTLTDIDGIWDRHVRQYSVYLEQGFISLERKTSAETFGKTIEEVSATHHGLLVFISHSSKDAELALALIDLLRTGLGLTADQIRCSSVDGHRLPVGVNTQSQLREEVNAARAVIGLITPSSLGSYYVMFELGARWGGSLFLAPLLAGVKPNELSGPLSLLNALSANNEAQLHQLLDDVSKQLGLPLQGASSYIRHISSVKLLADSVDSPLPVNVAPDGPGVTIQRASNGGLARAKTDGGLPEHRPRVVAAGYGKNEEQKSYVSYGLFLRNSGYDALEVQIPGVLIGLSQYTLTFPEKLSSLCERDHIRFIETFLEHETLPGLDGGQLHDIMRKANVELVTFSIYYQDTDFRWYRTLCAIERTNRTRNGLDVMTIGQELTTTPIQASSPQAPKATPLVVTDSDPHVYIEPLNDEWVASGSLPFALHNKLGGIAHNITIQALTIGTIEISFPTLAHLDVHGKHRILPNIEGGLLQLHDILSPLSKAWQAQGKQSENLEFSIVVNYNDVTKTKKFQTTAKLTYQAVQHLIAAGNALRAQASTYEIVHLDDTTFKRLS